MRFNADNITVYRYIMPAIESNMYALLEDGQALLVDPHINQDLLELLRRQSVRKVTVLLTHEHFDHISGVNWLRDHFAAEVICSDECAEALSDPDRNMARFWNILLMGKPQANREAGMLLEDPEYRCTADRTFTGEAAITWQGRRILMRQAPGHSKGGSLFYLDEGLVFSGDNLVNGTGVICRFPGGSKREYTAITRPALEQLPDTFWVLPGHGEPARMGALRMYLDFFGAADRAKQAAAK